MRATVQSLLAQAEYLGEIFLGITLGIVAQKVLHHGIALAFGRAQRQARDGPDELLELRGDAGVQGPVS